MYAYGQQNGGNGLPQSPNPPIQTQTTTLPQVQNSSSTPKKSKSKAKSVITSENIYLIPVAVLELLMLGGFIAMNYVFRFNEEARDASSLVMYKNLTLSVVDVVPVRPYFDYTISIDKNNELSFPYTFGAKFEMTEVDFFVPVFILPLSLICLTETVLFFVGNKQKKNVDSLGLIFLPVIRRSCRFYFVFLLYGCLAGMVTIFIKLLVPVPRPHFLTVCCMSDTLLPACKALGQNSFTVWSDCTMDSMVQYGPILFEALRSFPSYHATISIYSTTFLCLYIYYTMRHKGVYFSSGALSLPIVVMGLIGALHRWVTYHNTFWDIAWGSAIGTLWALIAVYGILNAFQERIWTAKVTNDIAITEESAVGEVNEAFTPATPLTRTEMVLSKPANYFSYGESDSIGEPVRGRSPATTGALGQARPNYYSKTSAKNEPPPGRPTQAFNPTIGLDERRPHHPVNYNQGYNVERTDYNVARQRYSIPPAPARPPTAPRPASVHPGIRTGSRYEGTSYF